MHIDVHNRPLTLGLVLALLLMVLEWKPMSRWLELAPESSVALVSVQPAKRILHRRALSAAPIPLAANASQSVVRTVRPLNGLSLRSSLRDYTAVFEGKVLCAGAPCSARVNVWVNTVRNPETQRTIFSGEDGNFRVEIPLSEMPHGQLDWKIQAQQGESVSSEGRARQILMDDPTIQIDNLLTINS